MADLSFRSDSPCDTHTHTHIVFGSHHGLSGDKRTWHVSTGAGTILGVVCGHQPADSFTVCMTAKKGPPSMTVGRFTISVPRPDGPGSLRASSALLATIPSSTNFSSTSPSHFLGQEPRKAIHKIPQGRECSGLASIHVGTLKQFIPKDCCCDVVPHINDESFLQKNYVGLY